MKKIAFIGLGKMGFGVAENISRLGKYELSGMDQNPQVRVDFEAIGGQFFSDIKTLLEDPSPKVVWVMLPAGTVTNQILREAAAYLKPDDVLVDAGNSKYTDTIANAAYCDSQQVTFLDVGTSGGMAGARNGACMMIGGDENAFIQVESLFADLCVENGYLYCGPSGSGHYLKMVHNGIEYGMMQSIGEGFHLLAHSPFAYQLDKVAKVFNHGSVIRSWLMELTEAVFTEQENFETIAGVIPSSGEGAWTVEEALKRKVSLPVITQALMVRYASEDEDKLNEKLVALLRNQFGGHEVLR